MNRCRRCVLPDTRPDTHFEDGVCSACRAYDQRQEIDWKARKEELLALLEDYDYRCIVPSSGGKDSHYQVLTLLELGAKPIVVTASTCHLTAIGRDNIDNLARYATTIESTPNRAVRAKLNRIGLEDVGDISWPEHASIFSTPLRMARDLGIPLLFYGESPQNQYGGPPGTEHAKMMTRRWVTEFGGFLGLRPADFVGKNGITVWDMEDYTPPTADEFERANISPYFLGQFIPWDSHRNAKLAITAGMHFMRPAWGNLWDHENLDNAQTGLHDHMMYRKYGYGRGCAQAAVDVRAGRATREAALTWIAGCDGAFPYAYAGVTIDDVLGRIGMTMMELDAVMERHTNWELFSGEDSRRPILKEFA